ncbi:putative NADH oxidase [Cladorrhinum sp. PSN332]|nr:putative NADH oxidase [Cladorrhinum sp. PSN332]
MTVTDPNNRRKRILIVGGVAGGMSCATRLRRLDERAQITVLESGPYISYANCGIPYALSGIIPSEDKLHLQTPEKAKAWFNVDVLTDTKLLRIDRRAKQVTVLLLRDGREEKLGYDKLVLSLGAEPLLPPDIEGLLKGAENNVFTLTTIPDLRGILGHVRRKGAKSAVVVGGAFIGLEAAENLKEMMGGIMEEVTVVERLPHVFPLADADMTYPIEKEMRSHGVRVLTNTSAKRIGEGKVYLDSGEEVSADLVIVAAGVRARMGVAKEAGLDCGPTGVSVNEYMQTSDPDVYAVGDMVETENRVLGKKVQLALAGPANRQGRLAADHICGKMTKYRGNVGTSVCKVFGKAIGMVGLGEAMLERYGIRNECVTVHPVNHAGYYPGSSRLTVKVRFDPETGRLLGGQCVGGDAAGVDKQTSVLAVAMMADMTVEDLEHLELAYAPPFGAAKDAVNMAGFVAGNVLRGDVEIVHAADFAAGRHKLEDFQVLDVRSPGEFSGGHINGAINIPIGELRKRLGELDKSGKKVLVYCQIGYRGYLGYRILKQEGFEVVNLDGGYRSVVEGGFDENLNSVRL